MADIKICDRCKKTYYENKAVKATDYVVNCFITGVSLTSNSYTFKKNTVHYELCDECVIKLKSKLDIPESDE